MKILFVTFYYPPFNSIGAIRTGKTVQYLKEMGHDVDVITAADQPLEPTLEMTLLTGKTHYTNWINVNWVAEFFSGGRRKIASQGFAIGNGKLNFMSGLGNLYKKWLNVPDGQIGWYPFALMRGRAQLKLQSYDLIFASCWPVTSLLVAWKLSKKHGVPWVAEMRDLWTLSPYLNLPKWRLSLEKKLEKIILRTAIGFVTVSELPRDLRTLAIGLWKS